MTPDPLRQLRWLAVAGAVVLCSCYVFFILTPWGQWLDDRAFLGRSSGHGTLTDLMRHSLDRIRVASLIALPIIIFGIGAYRRRWRQALTGVVAFAATVITAEILKIVLPRPDYLPSMDALMPTKVINTFPSGHAAIATATVLTLMLISAPRWRIYVAAIGCVWMTMVALGTVVAGWHRPSDAIGGIGLAVAYLAGATALLAWRRGWVGDGAFNSRARRWLVAGAVGGTALAAGLIANSAVRESVGAVNPIWFAAAVIVIAVAAVFAADSYARIMRPIEIGK